jgi:hypothetical protein
MTEWIKLPPGYYSESQVLQFIGWLSGDIGELHSIEVGRFLESWQRFKERFEIEELKKAQGENSKGL